jgi:hypothetical protein
MSTSTSGLAHELLQVFLENLAIYPPESGRTFTLVLERSSAATTTLPVYPHPIFFPNRTYSLGPAGPVADPVRESHLHSLVFAGVHPAQKAVPGDPQIFVNPLLPTLNLKKFPTKSIVFENVRLISALW